MIHSPLPLLFVFISLLPGVISAQQTTGRVSPKTAKLAAEVSVAIDPTNLNNFVAQPSVRYNLGNSRAYVDANIVGPFNVMKVMREIQVQHLLVASTISFRPITPIPTYTLPKRKRPIPHAHFCGQERSRGSFS